MLRIYFLQQWFDLSDPQAEDYDRGCDDHRGAEFDEERDSNAGSGR